jgi:hypothetical protein
MGCCKCLLERLALESQCGLSRLLASFRHLLYGNQMVKPTLRQANSHSTSLWTLRVGTERHETSEGGCDTGPCVASQGPVTYVLHIKAATTSASC